ncbi:MFS transporter, partial [Streptomyces sp. T-3]|nr:MFS transporter [Streptomyces sp. T-3]
PVPEAEARSGARLQGVRALLTPVVVAAAVGLALGAMDLLILAFAADRHHGDDVVAWVLAALSAGSAVGGLLNGAVNWRTNTRVRLPLMAVGLGLSLAAAGLAPGVGTLTVAVACAGFFVAPALTTAYLLADEVAAPGRRTQAGAWVNTAVNAGISGGTAVAGLLVARLPLGVCFALAGGVTLLAALACVGRRAKQAHRPLGDETFLAEGTAPGDGSPLGGGTPLGERAHRNEGAGLTEGAPFNEAAALDQRTRLGAKTPLSKGAHFNGATPLNEEAPFNETAALDQRTRLDTKTRLDEGAHLDGATPVGESSPSSEVRVLSGGSPAVSAGPPGSPSTRPKSPAALAPGSPPRS